jgi:RNA polymerase sigma factor (sigma-70 family)
MSGSGAEHRATGLRAATVSGQRLTLTQERTLLWASRHGPDEAARQRAQSELWNACHALVASVAQRHRRSAIELADLIGAGQLGLHAAIVRFDPDRFAGRLSTYAVPWIRWYMQDHISRNTGPVRLPSTTAHRQLTRWGARLFDEARRDCQRERVPTTETELCTRVGRRIGLSADEVARSRLTQSGATVTVDMLAGFGVDADGEDRTAEDSVIRRLDHEKLRRRVLALAESVLGERERAVFLARCMTGHRPIVQLDALAARFGVSRERIYQLEGSARRKIVTALGSDGTIAPDRLAAPPHQSGRRRAAV